ncbi:carbon storage regulator CsrA [Pseudomonas parafulva]|uniref:carbon storage regulator CsrA n=1 Tax=Pseudomonas parafulva TaxID=157782 RepID=UPI0022B2AA6F|nr:carbon storage regulator CsrA [Pseudomonas parafulva]
MILSRHPGQTLMVGDNIQVTIIEVKGNQVRIGIQAPKEVDVHRQEIYERIRAGLPKPNSGNHPQY